MRQGLKFIRFAPVVITAFLSAPQNALAQPAQTSLEVTVSGLNSARGVVRLAICPPGTGFPDCKDKAVRTATLPIENGKARMTFAGFTAGTYAVSVFHDANGNGKLDTFVGIPKEGYGFSRNPPFRPRAPRWNEAEMDISGATKVEIRIRYIF